MNSGLHIAPGPAGRGGRYNGLSAGIPAALAMLPGMALVLSGWLAGTQIPWWTLALAMGALTGALFLIPWTDRGSLVVILLVPVLLGVCGIFHRQVLGGLGCLANQLLERMTLADGRIRLELDVAGDAGPVWGILPLAALCVLLLQLSIRSGRLSFLLPVLLGVYGGAAFGLYPVDAGVFLLGLGTVLLLILGAGADWRGVPTWLLVPALCMGLAAAVALGAGTLHARTEGWGQAVHEALYHGSAQSLPEGRLKNLAPRSESDTPSLAITMTKPQKLYLRGAVYDTYDGTAWTVLEAGKRGEYESLFYWLHESGFYGQSQIAAASAQTGEAETAELTVVNLSACAAHGYYPYALAGNGTLDGALIGDSAFPAAERLAYLPGSVPQWYEVQHRLAADQDRAEIDRYLACEEAYEAYVTAVDLQMNNESWSVLERHLAEAELPRTLSGIRNFVRSWLEENLVYDEQVWTLSGGADFLQYTLEGSGSGYSVHYATAATLMLRYFGVPARYVEGYFLSGEEAASYQPGETIVLTERHAHAWVEYYLPGIGFVPFEVTPGYVDDEEAALGGSLSEQAQLYDADHLQYAQVEQPERIEEPRQPRISFSLKPIYLLYLLLTGLAVLVLLVLRRRRRFRRAMAAMGSAPNREAIALAYGYAVRLRESCAGLELHDAGMAALNREALFSDHPMTDSQRRDMEAYIRQVLDACKETWTIPEKLRYRLWDCLY